MGWCGSEKWCCGLKSWWYVVGSFVKSLWSLVALLLLLVFAIGLLPLCCLGVPLFLVTLVFTDWLAEREVKTCAKYTAKGMKRPRRQGYTTNEDAWAAVTNGSVGSVKEALGDLWGKQAKFDIFHIFLKLPLSILGFVFAVLSVVAFLTIFAAPLVWVSCGSDCFETLCLDLFWYTLSSCKDFPVNTLNMCLIVSAIAAGLTPLFLAITAVFAALELNLARCLLAAKYVTDDSGDSLVETSSAQTPTAGYREPPPSNRAVAPAYGVDDGKLAVVPRLSEAPEAEPVPVRYSAPPAPGAKPGTAPSAPGMLETPASWMKLAEAGPVEKNDRLPEVKKMLEEADTQDILGLSIQVGETQGTVTEYIDGRFKVAMASGEEVMMDKIEAEYVVAWLDRKGA